MNCSGALPKQACELQSLLISGESLLFLNVGAFSLLLLLLHDHGQDEEGEGLLDVYVEGTGYSTKKKA